MDLNFNEVDETPASFGGYTEVTATTLSFSLGNLFDGKLFGLELSYGVDWITLPIRLSSKSNVQLEMSGEGSDFLQLIRTRMADGDSSGAQPSVGFLTTHFAVLF